MEAILPALINAMLPVAGTLLSTLLSLALVAATKYVKSKTQNELVNSAMSNISKTVETVVAEVEQTLVPAYKAAVGNGKLRPEDCTALKNIAIKKVTDLIPSVTAQLAGTAVNDLNTYIAAKIEQAIFDHNKLFGGWMNSSAETK